MAPLDAATVERVLTSFDSLASELRGAGSMEAAKLPDDALGITALLWTIEAAVATMDNAWPTESPALLSALTAAGYEDSPYMVAEWKIEAERVLEAYEVLSSNITAKGLATEWAELERNRGQMSEAALHEREKVLIRKTSMLRTTARDIEQVAPYRQRLDRLTDPFSE
ncbi:MAG: hypothetical protein ACSLE2_11845 [Lysobacterales bacterium]